MPRNPYEPPREECRAKPAPVTERRAFRITLAIVALLLLYGAFRLACRLAQDIFTLLYPPPYS